MPAVHRLRSRFFAFLPGRIWLVEGQKHPKRKATRYPNASQDRGERRRSRRGRPCRYAAAGRHGRRHWTDLWVSDALQPLRRRDRGHDPGRTTVDVAVMLLHGGQAIADLAVLRDQP
jgi:hypothetical protein